MDQVWLCEGSSHGLKAISPGSGTLLVTSAVIVVIPNLHYLVLLREEVEESKAREGEFRYSFFSLALNPTVSLQSSLV